MKFNITNLIESGLLKKIPKSIEKGEESIKNARS